MKPLHSLAVMMLWPLATVAGMLLGGAVVTIGAIKLMVDCWRR